MMVSGCVLKVASIMQEVPLAVSGSSGFLGHTLFWRGVQDAIWRLHNFKYEAASNRVCKGRPSRPALPQE